MIMTKCSMQDWIDKEWKRDHLSSKAIPPRLFTVGRLDSQTTGLIFVTNDGALDPYCSALLPHRVFSQQTALSCLCPKHPDVLLAAFPTMQDLGLRVCSILPAV